MSSEIISLKPFKHTPSIEISTWYKGILTTLVATDEDTGGAFDLALSNMRSETWRLVSSLSRQRSRVQPGSDSISVLKGPTRAREVGRNRCPIWCPLDF